MSVASKCTFMFLETTSSEPKRTGVSWDFRRTIFDSIGHKSNRVQIDSVTSDKRQRMCTPLVVSVVINRNNERTIETMRALHDHELTDGLSVSVLRERRYHVKLKGSSNHQTLAPKMSNLGFPVHKIIGKDSYSGVKAALIILVISEPRLQSGKELNASWPNCCSTLPGFEDVLHPGSICADVSFSVWKFRESLIGLIVQSDCIQKEVRETARASFADVLQMQKRGFIITGKTNRVIGTIVGDPVTCIDDPIWIGNSVKMLIKAKKVDHLKNLLRWNSKL